MRPFLQLTMTLLCVACQPSSGVEREKNPTGGTDTPSQNKDGAPLPQDVNTTHTVLVIDDGFDTTHPVFAGKLTAKYTINCVAPGDEEEEPPTTLNALKESLIESYSSTNSDCTLEDDIDFELPSEFEDIAELRSDWNAAVESKSSDIADDRFEDLYEIVTGQRTKDNFHGTNTSSLIAYDNANVKLILVQMELGNASDALIDEETACPKQESIDLWVEAHTDEAVREAFRTAPVDGLLASLLSIIDEEKVTLANLSLGKFSSAGLAAKLAEEGCGTLDFSEQYRIDGELTREREVYRLENDLYAATDYMTVQAAGNEGRRIDDYSDAAECSDPELGLILAGSYDLDGKISDFSNYGECVDYYMLGSNVVVAAPDGYLDIVKGTSFSAPLLVRHITRKYTAETSYQDIIKGLSSSAGDDQKLPSDSFPSEVAFESSEEIKVYALKSSPRREQRRYAHPLVQSRLRSLSRGKRLPEFLR